MGEGPGDHAPSDTPAAAAQPGPEDTPGKVGSDHAAGAPDLADLPDGDLEALADAIECEAQRPVVHELWEAATDLNSGQTYWFNRALGESRWDPPPGWGAPSEAWAAGAAADPAALAAAAAPPAGDPLPRGPGYYYQDAYGAEQGPFSKEQLAQWRGLLPMDLRVWYSQGDSEAPAAGAAAGQGGAAAGPSGQGGRHPRMELALLLGDGALLARWREDNPQQAQGAAAFAAPTAAAYEADVGPAGGGGGGGGASQYAAAALAGLPPEDEAVQLARAATVAGKSIQVRCQLLCRDGAIGREYVRVLSLWLMSKKQSGRSGWVPRALGVLS